MELNIVKAQGKSSDLLKGFCSAPCYNYNIVSRDDQVRGNNSVLLYFSCYYSDVRSQLRGSQRSSISLIQPAAVTWTWPQWQNLKMGQSLASLGEHLRSVVSNQVCNRKYSITRIALHLNLICMTILWINPYTIRPCLILCLFMSFRSLLPGSIHQGSIASVLKMAMNSSLRLLKKEYR